jgi:hypothetical protein
MRIFMMGVFKIAIVCGGFCYVSASSALGFLPSGEYEYRSWSSKFITLSDNAVVSTIVSDANAETGLFVQKMIVPGQREIVNQKAGVELGKRCVASTVPKAGPFCPMSAKARPDGYWDFMMNCEATSVSGTDWKVAPIAGATSMWSITYSTRINQSDSNPVQSQSAALDKLEALYKNAKPANAEEAKQINSALGAMPKAREANLAAQANLSQLIADMKAQRPNLKSEQQAALDKTIAVLESSGSRISFKTEITEIVRRVSSTCESAESTGLPLIRRVKPEPKKP